MFCNCWYDCEFFQDIFSKKIDKEIGINIIIIISPKIWKGLEWCDKICYELEKTKDVITFEMCFFLLSEDVSRPEVEIRIFSAWIKNAVPFQLPVEHNSLRQNIFAVTSALPLEIAGNWIPVEYEYVCDIHHLFGVRLPAVYV